VSLQELRSRIRDQRGSLALELVVLTPVLALTLWVVGALSLRAMVAHAQVDSAARDAARDASIQRSAPAAQRAAALAATGSLQRARRTCQAIQVIADTRRFHPGGSVQVTVTCTIRLQDLGLSFLPAHRTSSTYTVPIDLYRGTQP
jgi:Flp pilus assembly protein TadG